MRSKRELDAAIRAEGRAVLIVNTRSRRGRRQFDRSRRLLAEAGLSFLETFPVSEPGRLTETFSAALALRPDLVVVGGGDGTIAEAVGHLAGLDVALGLLPLGTTNNFARGLHLPVGLAGAVAVLRDGKVADVDVGYIGDEVFANMVSIGLSVQVAERVSPRLKRLAGRSAYALTALRLLPRHRPFRAVLRIDGESHELTTHQLNIANGSHQSGRPFAADASLDDRLLAVYRLGDAGLPQLAAATVRHMLAGHRRSLADDMFLTTDDRVHVETDPPLGVEADGELRGRTPVTIVMRANALRVLVPQSFEDR
ncbi:diacylglycerol kinase [Actinomadura craniellae]|uniref:Diacylglycerol kinase n=1 Tax=Actinomadura craniellae TaxID=2231787 RepID=A0A365GY20_9ACTN|nr:YegS/Rv2252/BmrU family lipid kinase [Actinomadura craniellae]RAY11727.1 diacylglycerol kinase [Actinomadura craniellae]